MSNIAKHVQSQSPLVERPALTPAAMLDRAVASGSDVAIIEKLMGLQERWEANQARKHFDAAMTEARANMPVILKEQTKTGPGGTYRYEDLAGIARAIDPVLAAVGLSYRFRTESNGHVKVTCIISHRDGHSEENSLSALPDTSGSKNPIQAIGSAVTYLQRYCLKAALGLSASKDDDGTAAYAPPRQLQPLRPHVTDKDGITIDAESGEVSGPELISDEQRDELVALGDVLGVNKAAFCKHFNIASLADIPAQAFDKAKSAMMAKQKRRQT